MNKTFKKHGGFNEDLRGEAAALAWLKEAEQQGGLPAVTVLSSSQDTLIEEQIVTTVPTAQAARKAGRALAITHAAGAGWYGCPPPDWHGNGYVISGVCTPVVSQENSYTSWGAFFAHERLEPYMKYARDRQVLQASHIKILERICTRLDRGDFDTPQPLLVEQAPTNSNIACARIHGDLWAGNLLWDANPTNPIGAILIDPMAHGGHAETDLAMLALFGCAYLKEFIEGYESISPLADGWQERIALHQLSPLLLHCALFGSAYVYETMRAAERYI